MGIDIHDSFDRASLGNTRMGGFIDGKVEIFGDKFDASDLSPNCVGPYNRGERYRVKVRFLADRSERWGTLGITTGWKPCFLLKHNRFSHGSSCLLTPGTFQIIDAKELAK